MKSKGLITKTTLTALTLVLGASLLTACTPGSTTSEELQATTAGSSNVQTSPKYNVSAHGDSQQIHGDCAEGFHVAGSWDGGIVTSVPGARGARSAKTWTPTGLEAHGNYIYVDEAVGQQQNGTDQDGSPTYQVVDVRLSNASLISSHTGWYTWTCNSN